ncbi:MAG TPA: DoxX family protein [Thermoanaerobaculia bacterium]
MAPLLVQLLTTLLARIRLSWRDAARVGMVALLLFTAAARLSPAIVRDLAAMVPPPFTGNVGLVYLTGILEALGAIGLLIPRFRRPAAWCLIVLLIALFPANVYAALEGVQLRGSAATPLWLRTPLQILWIATLWWSTLARERRPAAVGSIER